MSNYRRLYIPGGTYFFTFADGGWVEQLRRSFREVKVKRPFDLLAAVVLPDHLHCLWRLPEGDTDFSSRWQMVKVGFSRHVPAKTRKDGAKTIWQPRFYEHYIRDESDLHKHLDYIHYNRQTWLGFLARRRPHSSFARFTVLGWYASSWVNVVPPDVEDMEHE